MADWYGGLNSGQLHLQGYEASYDVPGNYSIVQVNMWIERTSGSGKYSSYTNNSWIDYINGGGFQSGSGTYDLRGGGSQLLLSGSIAVGHNSDGTGAVGISGSFSDPHNNLGSASAGGTLGLTTIPRAPSAPSILSASGVTPAGFSLQLQAPSNPGGSAVTGYTTQVSTDSTFATGVVPVSGSSLTPAFTGLAPSSVYYARSYATNGQGNSPWSTTFSVTTSAAGAPKLAVVPSWYGTGFYLVLAPPFSVAAASVTTYVVTRQVTGPNAPADVTLNVPGTANSNGYLDSFTLASGQSVTYRAAAVISAVQTGFSDSVSRSYVSRTVKAPHLPIFNGDAGAQPSPFDPQTASWSGSVNASTSLLKAGRAKGWRKFSEGAGTTGALGTCSFLETALTGIATNSGLVNMAMFSNSRSAGSEGVRIGQSIKTAEMSQVFPTVRYYGQIVVQSDLATLLAAEIEWYNSGGVLLARTQGSPVVTVANTPVNLIVNGVAPVGAAYASVVSVDVAGTGWASENLRMVAAAALNASTQYPYFDGASIDTSAFSYEWRGTSWASPSLRTQSSTSGAALQDPNATPIPSPPQAPVVEESTITDDVVWRRYVAKISALDVHEWIAGVPTIQIYTAVEDARQVRIRWWKNPLNTDASVWVSDGQTYDYESIVTYIPKNTTFVIDGIQERAYVLTPSTVNTDAGRIVADQLLFGEDGGPVDWPALVCGTSYILTMDVPTSAADGNLVLSLNLTNRIL